MTFPIARGLMYEKVRINAILSRVFLHSIIRVAARWHPWRARGVVPRPNLLGRPDEYASLVVEMIRNGYFNGEHVRLDGAIRTAPRSMDSAEHYRATHEIICCHDLQQGRNNRRST